MSFYEDCLKKDILSPIMHKLTSGLMQVGHDGKIRVHTAIAVDSPWISIHHGDTRKCGYYLDICYSCYGFVHSRCFSCYKVVIKPKTLSQLFRLKKVLECIEKPSKCGIEVRDYVHSLYGGYIYADSVEEGMETYTKAKQLVTEQIGFIPIILKRGCTEYETSFGRSDEWEYAAGDLEKRLNDLIIYENSLTAEQPDFVKNLIYLKWIQFAYRNGDDTYLEFTDGKNLNIDYVTYHQEA